MKKITAVLSALLLVGALAAPAYAQTTNTAASATEVAMTYPVSAKLFGIFPLTLSAEAQVQSDGSVTIQYPWYAFLFSSDQAELETKLAAVGQAASALNTGALTAEQQLTLVGLLHASL